MSQNLISSLIGKYLLQVRNDKTVAKVVNNKREQIRLIC